eukprot:scaffold63721_cov78-Phaeocystis_antarctica.AAC.2
MGGTLILSCSQTQLYLTHKIPCEAARRASPARGVRVHRSRQKRRRRVTSTPLPRPAWEWRTLPRALAAARAPCPRWQA